jgi:hypothetical protein
VPVLQHVPAENIFSAEDVYPCVTGPPTLYKQAMEEATSSSSEALLRSSHEYLLTQHSGSNPTSSSSGSSSSRREAVLAAANTTATPPEAALGSSSSSSVAKRGKTATSSSSSRKKGRRGKATESGEGRGFGPVAENLVGVCLKFKNGKVSVLRLIFSYLFPKDLAKGGSYDVNPSWCIISPMV